MGISVFLVLVGSYLLGSIPAGYLAGRLAGVDVREKGSGNIGATNVLRVLGKKFGYMVFFCDALKGLLAVRLAFLVAAQTAGGLNDDWFGVLAGTACVTGHTFPVWLKFRGGKGVATASGVMLGLAPLATCIAVVVWVVVFEVTRYVSVASIAGAIALPLAIGIFLQLHVTNSSVIFYSAVLIAIMVCWRHRSNVGRLFKGTEQRFSRK